MIQSYIPIIAFYGALIFLVLIVCCIADKLIDKIPIVKKILDRLDEE